MYKYPLGDTRAGSHTLRYLALNEVMSTICAKRDTGASRPACLVTKTLNTTTTERGFCNRYTSDKCRKGESM